MHISYPGAEIFFFPLIVWCIIFKTKFFFAPYIPSSWFGEEFMAVI